MKMNLQKDLVHQMKQVFAQAGLRYPDGKAFDDVLVDYLTLNKKLIAPIPRTVHMSASLEAALPSFTKRLAVMQLKEKLERGANVNAYQSKRLGQFRFHDHMLYEWNIHHLHLPEDEGSGRKKNKKTNALLFAYIDSQLALLLDVDTHRAHVFADSKWLEIIYDNWPHIMEQWKTDGIRDLSHNPTNEERQDLWNHGITTGMIKIKEQIFVNPGLGRTASGHSIEVMLQANRVHRWLEDVEDKLRENAPWLKEQVRQFPLYKSATLCLRAKITRKGIVVYEEETGMELEQFG